VRTASTAAAGIVVGVRLAAGGAAVRHAALALIAAQTAFRLVKLTVYGESASVVFLALAATAPRCCSSRRRAGDDFWR
jgi:hypothetical protein